MLKNIQDPVLVSISKAILGFLRSRFSCIASESDSFRSRAE